MFMCSTFVRVCVCVSLCCACVSVCMHSRVVHLCKCGEITFLIESAFFGLCLYFCNLMLTALFESFQADGFLVCWLALMAVMKVALARGASRRGLERGSSFRPSKPCLRPSRRRVFAWPRTLKRVRFACRPPGCVKSDGGESGPGHGTPARAQTPSCTAQPSGCLVLGGYRRPAIGPACRA